MGPQIHIPVNAGPHGLVQVIARDEGYIVSFIFIFIWGGDHSDASNDVYALLVFHHCMLADVELGAA